MLDLYWDREFDKCSVHKQWCKFTGRKERGIVIVNGRMNNIGKYHGLRSVVVSFCLILYKRNKKNDWSDC